MRKRVGKILADARITIDYTKKEPDIKIVYPKRKGLEKEVGKNMLGFSFISFLILVLIVNFTIWEPYRNSLSKYKEPENCNFSRYNSTEYYVNISCDNGWNGSMDFSGGTKIENKFLRYVFYYLYGSPGFNKPGNYKNIIYGGLGLTGFYIIFLSVFFVYHRGLRKLVLKIGWARKIACKSIPKFNAKINGTRIRAVFTKVPDCLYLEIPLFLNARLDYDATGEFSKYLTKFEIKEHPFEKVKIKKGILKERERDTDLWYARFYFSEKPKTGKLEVFFK